MYGMEVPTLYFVAIFQSQQVAPRLKFWSKNTRIFQKKKKMILAQKSQMFTLINFVLNKIAENRVSKFAKESFLLERHQQTITGTWYRYKWKNIYIYLLPFSPLSLSWVASSMTFFQLPSSLAFSMSVSRVPCGYNTGESVTCGSAQKDLNPGRQGLWCGSRSARIRTFWPDPTIKSHKTYKKYNKLNRYGIFVI